MQTNSHFSRRGFLGLAAASPLLAASRKIPVGLEMYSVRMEMKTDLPGTVAGVAKMGYECVEFYAPYYSWTPDYAKEVRKQMDGLGIRCYSTHNSPASFHDDGIAKAIELNQILGSRYIVMASAGKTETADEWKRVAETLNQANRKFEASGLHAGYHNHAVEWKELEGVRTMDLLAANTDKSVVLQFDVGTCVEMKQDPVAWIERNPGRIKSMHLKDWSPEKNFRALFGEGTCPWPAVFAAAEKTGGVEYYLIEQEGSKYPEMETAQLCLDAFRKLRG